MNKIVAILFAVAICGCADVAKAERTPDLPSWTHNLDLKDWDQYGTFVGREIIDGQWKAGIIWSPYSVYRVDSQGWATRWFHAGAFLLTNAEKLNATFGPEIGIDVAKWTSQAKLTGIAEKGVSFWRPLGLTSVALSIDLFGGWTPIHTSDVHDWAAGIGARITTKFGQSPIQAGNDLLKKGL